MLETGQALLLNCRTAQSYCTAPGQSCWHHYWVHLDGAGVAAMEPLLLPDKKLTPVQLTGVRMQELFELVLEQMELGTVDSMVQTGLALHEMLALCAQSLFAQAEMTTNRQLILQAAETLRKNYRQELSLADLLSSAHMSKLCFYLDSLLFNVLFRYCIGLWPVALAKRVEKLLASPKPASCAISLMLWSVSTSSSFACVMRKLTR